MSTGRNAETIAPYLGNDLLLEYASVSGFYEDADLACGKPVDASSRSVDLRIATGLDNLTQAIANRLKTRQGELAPLGHPEYGSRHHELLGEPNVARTRNLIKLYVLQALRREPRIEKILRVTVRPDHDPPRDAVRIELSVEVLGSPKPLNLVVPFYLETSP